MKENFRGKSKKDILLLRNMYFSKKIIFLIKKRLFSRPYEMD